MDLEYLIGSKLKGAKGQAQKKDLILGKCRMPDLVSWRAPRDRVVVPYSPDTLERAHEALHDARKYASYAENDANPDDMRLAFWLVADDRAQVAHLLADRYKEHYKERVDLRMPEDLRAEVEAGLRKFRYDVGATPGSVSGECYFDQLLAKAVKHVKDIRMYHSKIGVKRPALQTMIPVPMTSCQTARRYAPSGATNAQRQYTGSVAAGGN